MCKYSTEEFEVDFRDHKENFKTLVRYQYKCDGGEIEVGKIEIVPEVEISEPIKQLIEQMCFYDAQEKCKAAAEDWRMRQRAN